MSLDWNANDIKDKSIVESPFDPNEWNPVTLCLVWKCMHTDIGTITPELVEEFWWRVRFLRLWGGGGSELMTPEGKCYLTKADIEAHIGLRTNVVTKKNRAAWFKKFIHNEPRAMPNPNGISALELLANIAKRKKVVDAVNVPLKDPKEEPSK